jgi:hypothetical protein
LTRGALADHCGSLRRGEAGVHHTALAVCLLCYDSHRMTGVGERTTRGAPRRPCYFIPLRFDRLWTLLSSLLMMAGAANREHGQSGGSRISTPHPEGEPMSRTTRVVVLLVLFVFLTGAVAAIAVSGVKVRPEIGLLSLFLIAFPAILLMRK